MSAPVLKPHVDSVPCEHQWAPFVLPAERGRVVQCALCRLIGYRRSRHGGPGKIQPYTCTHPACDGHLARHRMLGRGPRGAYIWACDVHSVQAQGRERAP